MQILLFFILIKRLIHCITQNLYITLSLINNNTSMSLFIGNVSKKVTAQEFEDAFRSHGNCKIDLRKRYAFVQFDSERCAEEAKQSLQNMNFSGLRLNIEWSKNSGRFNENVRSRKERKRGRSNSRERTSWRKEEKFFRRSPSYERRHAPSYSDNEETIDSFEPKCPRDMELLRRLKAHRESKIKPAPVVQPVVAVVPAVAMEVQQGQGELQVGEMQLQAGEAV